MPPSKIRLFTMLSQLIEHAEFVLSRPTDEKLRIELDAQLNTDDWPLSSLVVETSPSRSKWTKPVLRPKAFASTCRRRPWRTVRR